MPNNDIIIDMPRQGIAPSAMTGFADVRNLDLFSVPGVARLNRKFSVASGSTSAIYNWLVRNPLTSTEFFALSTTGTVYTSTDGTGAVWSLLGGNTVSAASGNGLAIWKDYLFVARDASLDTFGPLSGVAVTVTAATPCVISSTGHGLQASTPIIFSATTIPAGITAGTVYYVSDINLLTDSFQIKDAIGGSQINTTTTGSGVKYRTWYAPAGGGVTTFKTITSDNLWHPMIISKLNSALYGGEANQVFKLAEATAPFNPITAASYTWSATVLATALQADYRIKCLAEYGTNLMLGTWKGTAVTDFPVADIFPLGINETAVGNAISLNDFGIHALLTYGSSLIIWAGVNGRIYRSDGVNFSQVVRLPMDVTNTNYVIFKPGGVCIHKERIFFGTGNVSSGLPGQGVYSLQLSPGGNILILEHTISQETDGTSEQTVVGCLLPLTGQRIIAGWVSGSNKGIDTTSDSYIYVTAYTAYFDTPLFQVGTPKGKRILTELDILLAKTLTTTQGIRLLYRTSLSGTFATLGTFTHDVAGTTILGAEFSHFTTANIPNLETVQFRVALNSGNSETTPWLRQVSFK